MHSSMPRSMHPQIQTVHRKAQLIHLELVSLFPAVSSLRAKEKLIRTDISLLNLISLLKKFPSSTPPPSSGSSFCLEYSQMDQDNPESSNIFRKQQAALSIANSSISSMTAQISHYKAKAAQMEAQNQCLKIQNIRMSHEINRFSEWLRCQAKLAKDYEEEAGFEIDEQKDC